MSTARVAVAVGAAGILAGCLAEPEEPPDVPAPGSIAGWVVLAGDSDPGVPARVAAYASLEAFDRGTPVLGVETSAAAPRAFALDVAPGMYWLDAWCDTDGDRMIGPGDWYGFYAGDASASPVPVAAGEEAAGAVAIPVHRVGSQRDPGKFSRANSQLIK